MDRVEGTRPRPTGRGLSPQLLAIATLALVLRAYPLYVFYIHPDQEWIPTMAMQSLAASDWRPELLVYPSGLMYTLRVGYTAAYAVGRLLGRVPDRVEFLASYIERPFPFFLFARVWSVVLGVAGIIALAHLAERVLGARGGLLAALFLALAFLHVRESHYGSPDVPATTFFTATLLAAVWLHERQLRERARDPGVPSYRYAGVDAADVTGRWVVTIDHPRLTIFGAVPDQLAHLLGARATPVAEFVGLPEAAASGVQFDPTDANYTPLRGFDHVARPGPNIRIWRIGPLSVDGKSARPGRRFS